MVTNGAQTTCLPRTMNYSLSQHGFEIAENVLTPAQVELLREAVAGLPKRHRGGARNLLSDSPAVAELAMTGPIKVLADSALGSDAFAVRALCFDKSSDANWKVPWHQDTAIAVAERIDTAGFVGWSVKDGVPHVHPPAEILERMVALRLQLDDCGADNGPLRVLPGSHRRGILNSDDIERWKRRVTEVACHMKSGSVLIMRPLLLHASSPAQSPAHRRVIHIEYTCEALTGGLRWHVQKMEATSTF
jgi:ectoine hydroxylase-related dioxygenase (phytanoyl-CoA dioxygenase family)